MSPAEFFVRAAFVYVAALVGVLALLAAIASVLQWRARRRAVADLLHHLGMDQRQRLVLRRPRFPAPEGPRGRVVDVYTDHHATGTDRWKGARRRQT